MHPTPYYTNTAAKCLATKANLRAKKEKKSKKSKKNDEGKKANKSHLYTSSRHIKPQDPAPTATTLPGPRHYHYSQ